MNIKTYHSDATEAKCRFCSVLAGTADSFDSCWFAAESYKALISVGTLVPGWTLICPVNHTINLTDHYRKADFWRFASAAENILSSNYGECAMFEHGAKVEESLTGCGVGHAHSHLVPLSFSLEQESRNKAPELNWTECHASDIQTRALGQEYLFVASFYDGDQTKGSLAILEQPTSQFFRKIIAGKLGLLSQYDYKKFPMLEDATRSARELRSHAEATLLEV